MEEVTFWIFRSEEKYELTISPQRWTLFQMMVNKIKSDLKFSHIASLDNCTVQMVSSNTVCMKSKWVPTPFQAKSSRTFQGFSRALLWFIWIYLQPSKMFVLKAMFWAWIQHVYMRNRQTARAWKRVQTRHLVTSCMPIEPLMHCECLVCTCFQALACHSKFTYLCLRQVYGFFSLHLFAASDHFAVLLL